MTVKSNSKEPVVYLLHTIYYPVMARLSDVNLVSRFTGFGLYDLQVIEIVMNLWKTPIPIFAA